jgi:RNA polymerase sigma-70 factor (ECF subfamily)
MSENEQAEVFREWVARYTKLMARVARTYTAMEEDCEDLLQDILFQVWRSLPRFERKASPSTWIYRVALNTALVWQRKDRRRPRFRPLFDLADTPDNTGTEMQENLERLYSAIRQLPKPDAALVLLYLDDLSYREMSDILGISESNVGVKLNRARKALSEILKEVSHEF